jgi:sugar lactone lactonase YvrE
MTLRPFTALARLSFVLARVSAALALVFTFAACKNTSVSRPQDTASLLGGKVLPETFASPDGLTLGKDGNLYVSITQRATNWKHPAKIARIDANDAISDFFVFPPDPKSGKAAPMGIVFGSDGHLYVSDNQSFTNEGGRSSLVRVIIENAKPVRSERVATGINAANGITRWKDYIYVAEPDLRVPGKNLSGVYRFAISELNAAAPVQVTGLGDPHLILVVNTRNKAARGANGIGFDSRGNLYVNNFGDSEVLRYTFDAKGTVASKEVFANLKNKGALSVDGLQIDSDDNLWIADIIGNAVFRLSTETGRITFVAKSPVPNDGSDGALDTPSECIRRGDKLYVSNIDLPIAPSTADSVQTISVISLKSPDNRP